MKDISFKPLTAFIIALFVIATGDVRALPQQGKIESGSGDLSNPERIIQNSQNLRTSWQSFDIGKNEVVNIDQPNAAASIVIGVRNGSATNINGALNANGHVTLENPAGIQFGESSVVNVGGLVATTNQGALSSLGQINAATKVHLQNLGGNIVNVGGAVSAQQIVVTAPGGTIMLNANIDAGTAGTLTISTRATSDANPGIIAGGAIVFGTTAPVELIAKELLLHTSSTGGTRGTHPTTLTAAGATGTEGEAFIEVQGRLNFTDVSITSSGGFKVADLGDASGDVTSYETRLDTSGDIRGSGEIRINLGNHADVATGGVLASSTSTGGTLVHNLVFRADGNIYWDKGSINNQLGRVALASKRYTSLSIEGASVIKGKGVIIFSTRGFFHVRGGAYGVWVENTDADSFLFSGSIIYTGGDVTLKSEGHIRFRFNTWVRGRNVTYEAQKEKPRKALPRIFIKQTLRIGLFAIKGNVSVTGYLGATTNTNVENLNYRVILSAQQGSIIFGDFTDGTLTQTKVTGDEIILEAKNDFADLDTAPAVFSVSPLITIVGSASGASWQAGLVATAAEGAGGITITETDITDAGHAIVGGVLDLGIGSLLLQAGTSGTDTITLPDSITEIRADSIFIIGTIAAANDLTLTSAEELSWVSNNSVIGGTLTLAGTDVTLSGTLRSRDVITVTARGKFHNRLSGSTNIFLTGTGAIAPTAAGVFVRETLENDDIILTENELSRAGYTIINGVLDLGTDGLFLRAGVGYNEITLPPSVTSIRSSSVTIIGIITSGADLTFTSAGDLSFTGNVLIIRNVTLEGTDITLGGELTASDDLTVTARGKLLFGNGDNFIYATNISLTSAIAPTAADVAVITAGRTRIRAWGGTLTLNAKINVGTAGELFITTRGGEGWESVLTGGAIVFGTTAPVELTAKELRFWTSSTGGVRGTHPTTLTAAGAAGAEADAFIEVQGSLLFADVNIASSGGFKVTNLGVPYYGDVTSYTSRLHASGEMRVKLGTPTNAIGSVLASSTRAGSYLLHGLSFFALGGIYWDEGGIDNQPDRVVGIDNQPDRVVGFFRSYISTSIEAENLKVEIDDGSLSRLSQSADELLKSNCERIKTLDGVAC